MSFLCYSRLLLRTFALDNIGGYSAISIAARSRSAVSTNGKLSSHSCRQASQILRKRSFSSTSTEESNESGMNGNLREKQLEKRLLVLGKSALLACLTEHFLETYHDIDALKVANLVSYVTKEILPFNMDLGLSSNDSLSARRAKMYIEIGNRMSEKGKDSTLDEIRRCVGSKFSNSEIEIYSKLAHPVPLLKLIALKLGKQLEVRKTGRNAVKVFVDDLPVTEVTASTYEGAEYLACLTVVREKFMNEVDSVTLESDEEVLTREFKGKFDGQRVVELKKAADSDTYGIFLKGGEKATKQTEKFWEFNYIEPIFINKIVEGSPADKNGHLQEGDLLLAVGDFTLDGVALNSAVSMINEENSVVLTVKYDPEVKLRNKIKEEFGAMESRAFKDTLKSDRWGKWIEAHAEKNPDKYFKVG